MSKAITFKCDNCGNLTTDTSSYGWFTVACGVDSSEIQIRIRKLKSPELSFATGAELCGESCVKAFLGSVAIAFRPEK